MSVPLVPSFHAFDSAYVGPDLELRTGIWLRVDRGAIVEIGEGPAPDDAVRHDGVALPGLVDAHVHLGLEGTADVVASAGRHDPQSLRGVVARNASAHLSWGITTVRDLGCPADVVAAMVADGSLAPPAAPNVVVGVALSSPTGHGTFLARHASTTEEFLAAAERAADEGARVIKLFATGGVITAGTVPGAVQMPLDALTAVAAAAHARGLTVAVHAHGAEGIANALAAGVDSVEHASFLDEVLTARVREGSTWIVSTLVATERFVASGDRQSATPETLAKILAHVEHERAAARLAVTVPGRLVAGTDSGTTFNPHGGALQEQALLLEQAGLSPVEVLHSVTTRAAALVDPAAGALEVGRRADVVVLSRDPLVDLSALCHVREVMVSGHLVRTPLRGLP
jgi:imidazolonepropionase-like amidohydrolase